MRLPRRLGYGDRLTLVEHLDELRSRLVIALLVLGGSAAVTFGWRHSIISWLNRPLPEGHEPITLGVAEAFMTSLTVSLYAALALSLPVLLWQAWAFIAPAFADESQRPVARIVLAGTLLFASGMAFAYFIVLPAAIPFLTSFDSDLYNNQIRARDYYTFASMTILGVGLLFELPVILLGLVRLGVLTATKLRRNRRIGIVLCVAVAVILPGIDPVTTVLQAIPLLVLFEASIWLAVFFERRWLAAEQGQVVPLADEG